MFGYDIGISGTKLFLFFFEFRFFFFFKLHACKLLSKMHVFLWIRWSDGHG